MLQRQFPGDASSVLRAFGQNFGGEQLGNAEKLEFDRIETASRGCVDESQRTIQILGMDAGDFGNELDHPYASTVNSTCLTAA
jgi:hypothetical protein